MLRFTYFINNQNNNLLWIERGHLTRKWIARCLEQKRDKTLNRISVWHVTMEDTHLTEMEIEERDCSNLKYKKELFWNFDFSNPQQEPLWVWGEAWTEERAFLAECNGCFQCDYYW